MSQAGSQETALTTEVHPVLLALGAALTRVGENFHDLAVLETAISDLADITATGLSELRASDLTTVDRDHAELVLQKLHQLEQKLHLREGILTGFSLKLKELIEG